METLTRNIAHFADKINRAARKMQMIEKLPHDYGTGDPLHASEIHMIEMIGRHPGINVTSLAEQLGISKSAVTQVVGKIHKKGYVARYRDTDNSKEILHHLSEKGKIAEEGHVKFHEVNYNAIAAYLEGFPDNEKHLIVKVVDDLIGFLELSLDEFLKKSAR